MYIYELSKEAMGMDKSWNFTYFAPLTPCLCELGLCAELYMKEFILFLKCPIYHSLGTGSICSTSTYFQVQIKNWEQGQECTVVCRRRMVSPTGRCVGFLIRMKLYIINILPSVSWKSLVTTLDLCLKKIHAWARLIWGCIKCLGIKNKTTLLL